MVHSTTNVPFIKRRRTLAVVCEMYGALFKGGGDALLLISITGYQHH